MSRKKIMVVCDYFLPGFKGGGGMRSVVNLIGRFCDRYDFFVVTRNHDGRTDQRPYKTVTTGDWNKDIGGAQVYYLNPKSVNSKTIGALVRQIGPDAVFLNSVFSTPCISYLRSRQKRNAPGIPVILAPCGELMRASMALKWLKKRAFLSAAGIVSLHRGVIWKATTEAEVTEIHEAVGNTAEIVIAADLPPKIILPDFEPSQKPYKQAGSAHFACVARISKIKNIHYLLERLQKVKGEVIFDIIGPIEDRHYWNECKAIVAKLPRSVNVNYLEARSNEEILQHLVNVHFFALPSQSENFGYVFLEALAAGCPLMISDRTIWNDIEAAGAGKALPLESEALWEAEIAAYVEMGNERYTAMSAAARKFAMDWLSDPQIEKPTRDVLQKAVEPAI